MVYVTVCSSAVSLWHSLKMDTCLAVCVQCVGAGTRAKHRITLRTKWIHRHRALIHRVALLTWFSSPAETASVPRQWVFLHQHWWHTFQVKAPLLFKLFLLTALKLNWQLNLFEDNNNNGFSFHIDKIMSICCCKLLKTDHFIAAGLKIQFGKD